MKYELNFWVLGGDQRQAHLARLLAEDGHQVHTFAMAPTARLTPEPGLEGLGRADVVVLPLPAAGPDGQLYAPSSPVPVPLDAVLDALSPGQLVCGGRVDAAAAARARDRGLEIVDYFAREELAVANCVPTAEGCVQLAMEHLPITVHGARVLVVGYGRVGTVTAQRFHALGAKVTVAARRCEQLAWAGAAGLGTEHIGQLAGWLCSYDLVVNTVPAPVLGEAELADLRPGCLVIDLASSPGGESIPIG